jgi:hypothetical protein
MDEGFFVLHLGSKDMSVLQDLCGICCIPSHIQYRIYYNLQELSVISYFYRGGFGNGQASAAGSASGAESSAAGGPLGC